MKFGIGFIPQNNQEELIKFVKLAEDIGFEYAWIADHPNFNIYNLLNKLIHETETIKIGPGVTNPYIRTPHESASQIINIQKISNRGIFGIDAGNREISKQINIPWDNPIQTLKKSIYIIKKEIQKNNCSALPIYIGGMSPKLLEIGTNIADGMIINASHPKDYTELLSCLKKKEINNFDIAAYTATSIGLNLEKTKNASRIVVAFIIAGSPPHVLQRHDVSEKLILNIKTMLSEGNIGQAINLVDDNLIKKFSVTGTPKEVISQIENLKKSGVSQFIASAPIGVSIEPSIKLFKDVIASF